MVTTRSASSSASADWDPALKARMISHMSKDHSQDLSHILQHFNRLSAADAADAQMIDVEPSFITVSSRSGMHTVLLDPVLEWDARRQRLIDLTMEARRGLGIPTDAGDHGGAAAPAKASHGAKTTGDVVVQVFVPPQGWQWLVVFGVTFYYANWIALRAGLIAPGTLLWQLLEFVPFGPVAWCWLVDTIFALVVAIHVVECWWLDRTRLSKFGVTRGGALWWKWQGICFFEGVGSFVRFDAEVARLRTKEKAKR